MRNMVTIICVSLKELYNFVEQNQNGKATYGDVIATTMVDFDETYYDFNVNDTLVCMDGEEVEIISEEEDSVTLHSINADDGLNFKLSKEEFGVCTFETKTVR